MIASQLMIPISMEFSRNFEALSIFPTIAVHP
jgi:hypothetical protein